MASVSCPTDGMCVVKWNCSAAEGMKEAISWSFYICVPSTSAVLG